MHEMRYDRVHTVFAAPDPPTEDVAPLPLLTREQARKLRWPTPLFLACGVEDEGGFGDGDDDGVASGAGQAEEVVRMLLEAGADPTSITTAPLADGDDADGESPIHRAARMGNTAIIEARRSLI
jgi:hypothetical protein